MNKMTIFSKILITIAALGAIVYTALRKKIEVPIEDTLSGKKYQRIRVLNLPDILQWVQDNIPSDFVKGEIRVFPKGKAGEIYRNSNLSKETLDKCVYFDVVNNKNEIVLYKLVAPEEIAEDLNPIKEGKVYKVPVEM